MSEVVTDVPVSSPPNSPLASSTTKTIGRVKWFNNKVGYGFITVIEGEEMDVFVHHSSVIVASQQYKYLVEGEYVQFVLSESSNEEHKYLATEVSGINGGKLMCETRNMHNENRRERDQDATEEDPREGGRGRGGGGGGHRRESGPRGAGAGPRGGGPRNGFRGGKGGRVVESYDGDQWMLVRRGGRDRRQQDHEVQGPGADDI